LGSFIKSETFNKPSDLLSEWDVQFDPSVHGFSGPTQTRFPPFDWPSTRTYESPILPIEEAGN